MRKAGRIATRMVGGALVVGLTGGVLLVAALMSGARFDDVFTSSTSAFYLVKTEEGGLDVTRSLPLEETGEVVFELNLNRFLNGLMKGMAVAREKPLLELTWDDRRGAGGIKQYRSDGTMLLLSFSRFAGDGIIPRGLFLGGNLPYEDRTRDNRDNSSGLGYFDGQQWNHIWCNSNEGFQIMGTRPVDLPPFTWDFMGSRVVKNTGDLVVLESDHEVRAGPYHLGMKRWATFRAGDNYFVLNVRFTNLGDEAATYDYSWGDEPWVGGFGASRGDVGWHEDGPIWTEKLISPVRKRYVGYWDAGNPAAGEVREDFTGLANFVEWFNPLPSAVFLSNDFQRCCDESRPLASRENRVLNLLWLNQILLPGRSRTHTLAIGMADRDPETGRPVKPQTVVF